MPNKARAMERNSPYRTKNRSLSIDRAKNKYISQTLTWSLQAEVGQSDKYGLLQEFFDPGPICSDLVQVELNPNKTVQVDLEHRADSRF